MAYVVGGISFVLLVFVYAVIETQFEGRRYKEKLSARRSKSPF